MLYTHLFLRSALWNINLQTFRYQNPQTHLASQTILSFFTDQNTTNTIRFTIYKWARIQQGLLVSNPLMDSHGRLLVLLTQVLIPFTSFSHCFTVCLPPSQQANKNIITDVNYALIIVSIDSVDSTSYSSFSSFQEPKPTNPSTWNLRSMNSDSRLHWKYQNKQCPLGTQVLILFPTLLLCFSLTNKLHNTCIILLRIETKRINKTTDLQSET